VKNYKGFGRRYYDTICLKSLRSPSRVPKQSQKLNPRYRCALISKKNLYWNRQEYRTLPAVQMCKTYIIQNLLNLNLSQHPQENDDKKTEDS
jgi:hypothetical protein